MAQPREPKAAHLTLIKRLRRFEHDVSAIVGRAHSGNHPEDARALLSYFSTCVSIARPVCTEVMQYLQKSFESAQANRWNDLGKALGIVRHKTGNPGKVSDKRPLTEGMREELRQEIIEELSKSTCLINQMSIGLGKSFKVSQSTVRDALKGLRDEAKIIAEKCYPDSDISQLGVRERAHLSKLFRSHFSPISDIGIQRLIKLPAPRAR